ncbi:MAG: rRNA adenine N-6-methyltransferase family protein [Verrucomicrobiota bacterium]
MSGAEVDLTIEKVVFGGDGLSRTGEGVVLTPGTAPGERVRVRPSAPKGRRRGFRRAELVEVLAPSRHRVRPRCQYYGQCGGCQYQHLSYREELRIKTAQVREAFERIAKLPAAPVEGIVPSPRDFGYRNRVSVHVDGRGRIGYHRADGRGLVDITHCPIAMPEVNAALAELRRRHRAAGGRWDPGHVSLRHPQLPPGGFVQANHFQLANLRRLVLEALQPAEGVKEWSHLIEGYAGAGFLTRELLSLARRVTGIEQDPRLVAEAGEWIASLELADAERVEWIGGAVELELAPVLARADPASTAVLLDPPRGGLAQGLPELLVRYRPTRLVYVSCDPPALARDAVRLAAAFRLTRVVPVDLFPRTAQIECVAGFEALPVS